MTVGRIWTRCFWPFFWLLLSPWWLTGDISTTVGTFQPPCRLKKTNKPEDLASYTRAAQQVGKAKHWNIRNLDHFWEVEGCKGGVLNPPTQRKFMKKNNNMLTKAFVTTGVLQVLVPRYCVTSPSPSSCRKGRWCFLHKPHQQLPPGQPMDHGDTVVDAVGERCMWCPSCKKSRKPWWGPMDASLFYLLCMGGSWNYWIFGYHEFFPIISIHLLFSGFPCWNFQGCPHDITCVQSQFGVDRSGGYGASLWSGSQCLWDSWKVAEGLTTHGPRTPTQSGGQSGADLDESCITHFLLLVDLMHTTRLS